LSRNRKRRFFMDLRKITFLEIRHGKPENARMSDKKADNVSDNIKIKADTAIKTCRIRGFAATEAGL
jgi:hypothetical protein